MNKLIIPCILVIFVLWILLQLALKMSIFANPLNYFIVIILLFLTIKMAKEN
ncbi:hypothetical protein LRR81_09740 [Metabacillus sp. GX 13764]|uniref:hypothetical protein n=1 Tax=Metabacillus kandeliae TaxID=2900151 RepID=UPI001E4D3C08|nr:hypothetical protein [Metabacillus kandeliae]MCD7034520.1 hypothetical protein [Metabacillus kandeliae]